MEMEQARHGVDYHEEGADVHPYLLALLLIATAFPVALAAFLVLWVL